MAGEHDPHVHPQLWEQWVSEYTHAPFALAAGTGACRSCKWSCVLALASLFCRTILSPPPSASTQRQKLCFEVISHKILLNDPMRLSFSLLGMAVSSLSLPSRAINTMEVILHGGCLPLICYYIVLVFSGMM